MDWKKRREELRLSAFSNGSFVTKWYADKVITQEQSMLSKAEEEKKKIIEAIIRIKDMIHDNCIADAEMTLNNLIQKNSDKKEDDK